MANGAPDHGVEASISFMTTAPMLGPDPSPLLRGNDDREPTRGACYKCIPCGIVRGIGAAGSCRVVHPRPVMPRGDLAGTAYKTNGTAKGPRDVSRTVLGRMQGTVRKTRRHLPRERDRRFGLDERPLVHAHLRHKGAAYGPGPLALIVDREPPVGWMLAIGACDAVEFQDGR